MADAVRQGDLTRSSLFRDLDEAALAPIVAVAVRRRFVDGETIFEQGDPATTVFVVLGGRIALRSTVDGRSVIVQTIEADELIGWSALREGATRLTTGRAVGDVEVVEFPVSAMLDLLSAGGAHARTLIQRLLGIASAHLDATRAQLQRFGGEGVITGG